MKKIYPLLLTFAAGSIFSLSAQQLPNNGFENEWSNCTPWTSKNNTASQGTTPAPWNVSNTVGTGTFGKTTIASKVAGHTGSNAVELKAESQTGNNNIPAYMSLGTAWATAKATLTGSKSQEDGGTFGGTSFAYRPDAVSFYYKRSGSTISQENATVVVYAWKGSTSQADVPGNIYVNIGGSASKTTMTDRDRNILGMETSQGGAVTKSSDFELIASTTHYISGEQTDWANLIVPIDYKSTATPEKFNVIFAAGDYFASSPATNGNPFTIDDVTLVYFSRLATIKINGAEIDGFDNDIFSYTVNGEMPDESAFAFTCLSNSGSSEATLSLDKKNHVATITVTHSNAGGTDIDGQATHTYTIKFKPQATTQPTQTHMYSGDLSIDLLGDAMVQDAIVYITDNGDGTCSFLLPDFALDLGDGPVTIGDIKVENVTISENADGSKTYTGSVKGLELLDGEIIADVEINGEERDGRLTMSLPVIWEGITIDVLFNGDLDVAGVESVGTDNANAPVEYYNLNGIRIDASSLTPGIYVVRKGTEVKKVLVK